MSGAHAMFLTYSLDGKTWLVDPTTVNVKANSTRPDDDERADPHPRIHEVRSGAAQDPRQPEPTVDPDPEDDE